MSANGRRLFDAAEQGNLALVHQLALYDPRCVKFRTKWTKRHYNGETALHQASKGGHLEIAILLIEKGANVHAKSEEEQTPLHFAINKKPLSLAIVQLLVEHGADPNARAIRGPTPFGDACRKGLTEIVEFMMPYCISQVDVKEWSGKTPLHFAFHGNHFDIARVLIENGANINIKDSEETTPFQAACRKGYMGLAKLLVKHGANVEAKNQVGFTALHEGCLDGKLNLARFLLDNQANVNAETTGSRFTPLHIACRDGRWEIVQLLISRGANVFAESTDGETPLHLSCQRNHVNVVWLLVRRNPGLVVDFSTKIKTSTENDGEVQIQPWWNRSLWFLFGILGAIWDSIVLRILRLSVKRASHRCCSENRKLDQCTTVSVCY